MAKKKEQEPKKFNNPNVVGLRAEVLEQPASANPASATAPVAAAPMKPRRDIWSDMVFPFLGLPVPRRQLLIGTSERKARSSAKG